MTRALSTNTIQYNKTTVECFYQVEELGEGYWVSKDGALGQVTRQRDGNLKMDYNTAISCCY